MLFYISFALHIRACAFGRSEVWEALTEYIGLLSVNLFHLHIRARTFGINSFQEDCRGTLNIFLSFLFSVFS